MPSETTLKDLSLSQLEQAFGEALSKLVGRPCTVNLTELKLGDASVFTGSRDASISGSLHIKLDRLEADNAGAGYR